MRYLVGILTGAAISVLLWFTIDLFEIYILNLYDNFMPIITYALLAMSGAVAGLVGVKIGKGRTLNNTQ